MRPSPPPSLALSLRPWAALAIGLCLAACSSSKDKLSREQQISTRRELGSYYFQVGEIGRAEDQALRGLELDRDDKELRLLLGRVKLRRGDTESLLKAKLVFEGFDIKQEPRAAIGLGETLERLGLVHRETAEAIERGDRAAPKGDAPAEIKRLRDEANRLWEQSTKAFETALAFDPEELRALNGLQRTNALMGRYDEASKHSDRLIELAEAELEAIGRTLSTPAGTPDAARDERLRVRSRETRNLLVETRWLAYSIENSRQKPAAALAHLDRIIQLTPNNEIAYSRRAQVQFDLGNYQAAIDDALEFVRRSDKPLEDPDIRKAWQLRYDAEAKLP
jgi:tetratricopeptide (TPR) repeat protein